MRFALCAMRFLDRAYSIAMTACKAGVVAWGMEHGVNTKSFSLCPMPYALCLPKSAIRNPYPKLYALCLTYFHEFSINFHEIIGYRRSKHG